MIEIQQHDDVTIFHMAHGKANILDVEFCTELVAKLHEHRRSASRALIITGKGSIFSGGVDLNSVMNGKRAYLEKFLPALEQVYKELFTHPKPVVAAINGHAIAGGCILACAADYRLMAGGAGQIGIVELRVGVSFPIMAFEVMRAATAEHAAALMYEGATMSAADAKECGMVHAVVTPEELMNQALIKAQSLGGIDADAFALTKLQLREPNMERVRKNAAELDVKVLDQWSAPSTLAAMADYVAATLKRRQK